MKSGTLLVAIVSILSGLGVCAPFESGAHAETYAEKLGWPKGTRVVIFHVDDCGMSHDSNMGTFKAVEDGMATSFSIMMPCPWVPEAKAWVEDHSDADAGLHLTLNSEWKNYRWGPTADRNAVPGLIDGDGYLHTRVSHTTKHASADEVEAEIRAQVSQALSMGIKPTHLDTHMGTCLHPEFVRRYIKVGKEAGIPVMMFGGHMQHIGEEIGAFHKPLVCFLAHNVWNDGLPVLDDLVTSPTHGSTYEERKKSFMQLLRELKPGVTQIILHCTLPSENFHLISSTGSKRHDEMKLMLDPDIKGLLAEEGIATTTWRELYERRQRMGKKDATESNHSDGEGAEK